jgi:hypothetical protein
VDTRLPQTAAKLLPSERRLVTAMQRLGFGRFERLKIQNGQAILTPWPLTIRGIKFGSETARADGTIASEFTLGQKIIQLLQYIRGVKSGEIRNLTFRHGEPFSMEIETVETTGSVSEFPAGDLP